MAVAAKVLIPVNHSLNAVMDKNLSSPESPVLVENPIPAKIQLSRFSMRDLGSDYEAVWVFG